MSESNSPQSRPFDFGSTQLAFEDLLVRFLRYSRDSAERNHASHLARAIGRFFAFCSIEVLWFPDEEAKEGGFSACGARWELPDCLSEIHTKELLSLLRRYQEQVRTQNQADPDLAVSGGQEKAIIYVISRSPQSSAASQSTERLWLIVIPPVIDLSDDSVRRILEQRKRFLRLGSDYLETIHTAFVALHRPPWAAELSAEVRSFIAQVEMDPRKRLVEATTLISNVADIWIDASTLSLLKLAQDIAQSVVQSLIGNGVDVNVSLLDGCRPHADAFVTKLQVLVQRGKMAAQQLGALCRTVQAIAADSVVCEGCTACRIGENRWSESIQDSDRDLMDLDLIADWTGLHQYARRHRQYLRSDQPEEPKEKWYPWAHRTFERLKHFLRGHFRIPMKVPYVPSWLRLWFCHDLLFHARLAENAGEVWDDWYFCEHLAYVVRESLRVFGDGSGYSFRPPSLAEALRTVVEQHALHVLHLPSDPDIRGLLNEISSMHASLGYFFVTGHLQHVLEVYIAGQFLCELTVEIAKEDWTVEQILASRSAWKPLRFSLATGEFRRAFSLAALLHDVGRLLLPRWLPTAERWLQVDKVLLKSLAGVENSLLDSLAQLMRQCEKDLETEGYFDPASERAVHSWVEDRVERREVDFPLISAWFLHRLCQNIQGMQGDTVRQAVRAVLFHQMVTQVVEVDRDPAAALLILCDQIFAWNANKTWVAPGETGHSFQAIAADLRPQPPLFELLELDELKPEPETVEKPGESSKPLKFRVQRKKSERELWPHFVLTLQKPESLEVPVHRVWIGLAQSLGRIRPSEKHQWAPRVTVRSQNQSTYDLLQQVVNEDRSMVRGALSRFISEVKAKNLAKVDRDAGIESIELRPLGHPLYREDLSLFFPDLERLLEKLLSMRDRRL